MKQKFLISRQDGGKSLVITEYAEIDKEIFSILCEETYDTEEMKEAAKEGVNFLVSAFKTRNFFPPIASSIKIAQGILEFLESGEKDTIEVLIDETDSLEHYHEPIEIIDDLEAEEEQIDDLLEETVDVFDENIGIKKINSSIQMDEDELLDDNGDV